jgi:basic amino acid/polyamine antiporter, APA family
MVQSLGLFSSTTLVVGSMIGSGIYLVDADIARMTDSPALLIAAWIITAVMTMIGALSYGELAAMMPKAGGQYIYLRESLGHSGASSTAGRSSSSSRPAPSPP